MNIKINSRTAAILTILFGYILLQFIWWEVLLVRQTGAIMNEQQKLLELSVSRELELSDKINQLHRRHQTQTIMIVCEGTVFLLLLLFGMHKVKKAIDKEQDLKQQQQNFFLSITHELKTPISATKLQLQTLLKQKLPEQKQTEILQAALTENERLNKLIDNVLLASRVDSATYSFNPARENLSVLIEQVTVRYYAKLIESGALETDIQANVFAETDAQTFPSIITNLIDNAVKYSGADRKIKLRLQLKHKLAVLTVEDNGFGIDESDRAKIFERFYRVGSEDTRQTKGTGLGLFIVQTIVQKHKGEIKVYANQPRGTVFEIQLHAA